MLVSVRRACYNEEPDAGGEEAESHHPQCWRLELGEKVWAGRAKFPSEAARDSLPRPRPASAGLLSTVGFPGLWKHHPALSLHRHTVSSLGVPPFIKSSVALN